MNTVRLISILRQKYLSVLFVLIVCKVLLFSVVVSIHPLNLSANSKDSTWWNVIQNVENGKGFKSCEESYVPNCAITNQVSAMREPLPILLYALIGKLTGNALFVFQYLQLPFDLLILWGIFMLTQELSNRTLALLAAFLWTSYLPLMRVEVHINGDLVSGVFVTWGMLLFVKCIKHNRLRDWIGFGILFGLAALSRSATLAIAFVLLTGCALLWLTKNRKVVVRFKDLAVATIALGLVFSPWVIRNMIVFGEPIIGTTLIGYNLYRHNAIVVGEIFPHYIGPVEAQKEIRALISRHPELQTPINEAQVDQIFRAEAIRMIRAYPEEYAELVAYRFIPLWFNIGVLEQYGESMVFVDDLVVFQQFILLTLLIFVLWRGTWMHRSIALGLLLFMLSYMAVDSQLRYLIPIMPVVVSMSVLSFGSWFPNDLRDGEASVLDGQSTVSVSKHF